MIVAAIVFGVLYALYFLGAIFVQVARGETSDGIEIVSLLMKVVSFALFVCAVAIAISRC